MNDIILKSCEKMLNTITDSTPREDFFQKCVEDRLLAIYHREDAEYDEMLSKLETSIDYNDFYGVKRSVTKIMKALSKNRNNLLSTIERLSK